MAEMDDIAEFFLPHVAEPELNGGKLPPFFFLEDLPTERVPLFYNCSAIHGRKSSAILLILKKLTEEK
ncbi:MAG: hypothetical protein HFE64_10170 [Lachnospiraceae bacterium]|jgi:hypothetical protein|nr:hypothetical protein [Lachnospiraceae bacterium]